MAYSFLNRRLLAAMVGPMLRRRNQRGLTILMFHGFTDQDCSGLQNAQHKHLCVRKFERFIHHLRKYYHVISLDEAQACLHAGSRLPGNSVVITFDDGFRSNYQLAYPLLKRWSIPATIYLATEFVNERRPIWVDRVDHALGQAGKTLKELVEIKRRLKTLPQEEVVEAVSLLEKQLGVHPLDLNSSTTAAIYQPLAWNEIAEMQTSGLVSFGAHTHTHKIMGRCRDETVRQEVRRSKAIIEEKTARPCVHFCYPNGGPGDFSERSEDILMQEGYLTSVLAGGSVNRIPCAAFSLDRLGVTNGLSQAEFEMTVCGFLPLLHELRQKRAARRA